MIVKYTNRYYRGLVAASDSDAIAYVTATQADGSTLTTTQISAIDTFVKDLKIASIWIKMKAIYLFVGGTTSLHKWNLKDPRDLDAAYRLIEIGSPTNSSNGVQFDGSTQYIKTSLIPTSLTVNSTHISAYSRIDQVSGDKIDVGSYNSPTTDDAFELSIKRNGFLQGDGYDTDPLGGRTQVSNTSSVGFFTQSRTAINSQSVYINGSNVFSTSTVGGTLPPQEIYIGARNQSGTAVSFSSNQICYVSIGDGLTNTEVGFEYTAVQKFQTTLGRQV